MTEELAAELAEFAEGFRETWRRAQRVAPAERPRSLNAAYEQKKIQHFVALARKYECRRDFSRANRYRRKCRVLAQSWGYKVNYNRSIWQAQIDYDIAHQTPQQVEEQIQTILAWKEQADHQAATHEEELVCVSSHTVDLDAQFHFVSGPTTTVS